MKIAKHAFDFMVTAIIAFGGAAAIFPVTARAGDAPLGASVHEGGVSFRIWAPYVDSVAVRINDASSVPMEKEPGHSDAGDTVWATDLPSAKAGDRYKYFITCNGKTGAYIDPFGLQLTDSSPGAASIIVDMRSRTVAPFKTPALRDTVIYEMHIGSFHADDAAPGHYNYIGATQKLGYLEQLGVNAIELLPINENAVGRRSADDYDWGYDPSSYFAFKTAYGTPGEFVDFVNACHAHGIAVLVDVVYNHMSGRTLLRKFGGYSTPEYPDGVYFNDAAHGGSPWGPRPDFSRPQVAEMLKGNALLYLNRFGCDGKRWDSVSNLRLFNEHDAKTVNPAGVSLMQTAMAEERAAHPDKLFVAEDLKGEAKVTEPAARGGLGFNTQWDDKTCWDVRRAVSGNDTDPKLRTVADAITRSIGPEAFARVIYTENHDKAGHPPREVRVPRAVDPQDPQSEKAKRLSTLAAGIILTAPGVPMLFQGQEMLDPRTFTFGVNIPMEWNRVQSQAGTIRLYHDLIALRRNQQRATAGLEGASVKVFHLDQANHTIAYRRWDAAHSDNDVIVVANFSGDSIPALRVGIPRAGTWHIRFNSGASIYDSRYKDDTPSEITASPDSVDGFPAAGHIAISPYSLLILSRDSK